MFKLFSGVTPRETFFKNIVLTLISFISYVKYSLIRNISINMLIFLSENQNTKFSN